MAIAQTSDRLFAIGKQSALGTLAATNAGKIVRRTSFDLNPTKATLESSEKRPDFQTVTYRHGVRGGSISLNSEFVLGDKVDLMASCLRKDLAAVSAIAASAGDGFSFSSSVLTRAAGGGESFIADGVKVGHVVSLADHSVTANNSRNFVVTAITATTLTLVALDGVAISDGAGDESCTLTVRGKSSWVPSSGFTNDLYTIEDYVGSTYDTSIRYDDCRFGGFSMSASVDSIATLTMNGLARNFTKLTGASAPYFVSPTAASETEPVDALRGLVLVNGATAGCVTSIELSTDLGLSPINCFGETASVDLLYGREIMVQGTIQARIESSAWFDAFDAESEVSIMYYLEERAASGALPHVFGVVMPRVKLNGVNRDDPDQSPIQSIPFRALKGYVTSGQYDSSLAIQDSRAP